MPRRARSEIPGLTYHVLNRGNGGATLFHCPGDYRAFLELLLEAKSRHPVKVFAFCLMPNHFHLVVQPLELTALGGFMHWWMTTHVRRYHGHYERSGHLWQDRYKSFPIQHDAHLLTVLRYVVRNPVRATLVDRAVRWPWSSLQFPTLTDPWPMETPPEWQEWVEAPLSELELQQIRASVTRQAPFGSAIWQESVSSITGRPPAQRPRGRPRKK